MSEAAPASHLPFSPRWPVPRASPCRTWWPGWPGPSRTTSCGLCATPASAPCAPTASTQVTPRGPFLSRGGAAPTRGPGPPRASALDSGPRGWGCGGRRRLKIRASQQATLLVPLLVGWGPQAGGLAGDRRRYTACGPQTSGPRGRATGQQPCRGATGRWGHSPALRVPPSPWVACPGLWEAAGQASALAPVLCPAMGQGPGVPG